MQQVDHPNIINYFETYEDESQLYLVMELCTGGDMSDKLAEKGVFSETRAANYLQKLVKAVYHCHSQNIIHRDLKPANVMFDERGEVRVIDFGISIRADQRRTLLSAAGTPLYIAPEVFTNVYGRECDVWSLGVMLYEMLTGKHPFTGNSLLEVKVAIRDHRLLFPPDKKIDESAKHLIKRMLERNVSKRITSEEILAHPWM